MVCRGARTGPRRNPLVHFRCSAWLQGAKNQSRIHHCITEQTLNLVIPAQAGIQIKTFKLKWIPICMGMTTVCVGFDLHPFY